MRLTGIKSIFFLAILAVFSEGCKDEVDGNHTNVLFLRKAFRCGFSFINFNYVLTKRSQKVGFSKVLQI